MINLLPPDSKKEFRAGRINTQLIRYLTILAITAVCVIGVFGVSFVLNERNKASYVQLKEESDKKLGSLKDTRDKVQAFNENIKQARAIYGSEIILSDVVAGIAKALPPGAVIGTLTLDTKTLATPITLTVRLDSFNKGAVLKENFEASGIFKDVKLVGIEAGGKTGGASVSGDKYPFSATITATLVPASIKAAQAKGSQ